jgi:predicted SAM-dependent methyltransferase
MRSAEILKRFVERPSTRRALRNAQIALGQLWSGLKNELKYGRDLRDYCRGKTEILLNIGCGDLIQEGWVNIDLEPRSGALYFNVLNPLPIDDQAVTHIHAEHCLEHLEYSDAIFFLGECHRILKTGGTMRIVVPDAERYMRAYVGNDRIFFERLEKLGGTPEPLPTKVAICNQMFRMAGAHRFAWDFDTLENAIRQIGYRAIQKSHHNDSSAPHCIDGQDWWRPIESLYVNLIR